MPPKKVNSQHRFCLGDLRPRQDVFRLGLADLFIEEFLNIDDDREFQGLLQRLADVICGDGD